MQQEEKDHLVHNLEVLQVQQTTTERELLETTTRLRKAQQGIRNKYWQVRLSFQFGFKYWKNSGHVNARDG
jgi:hypothetical protein